MTEREWDKALHIQTIGREDETGAKYMPYEPTPYPVLERLAASGLLGPNDCLLDCGCGKGRAAIFLAAKTGCRAVGIDHSEKLVAMAEQNRLRSAVAGLVRFECTAAERMEPGEANVFFFFNPFSEAVLRVALRRILRAENGRQRLFFYYPSGAFIACLDEEARLARAGEIDCRDLFDGNNPREVIAIYETTA